MLHTNNEKRFFSAAILLSFLTIFSSTAFGQVYTNKEVGKENELKDSLQKTDYPYMLPIWGKKVAKKGYNLPYSAGVSVNYLWQKSDLVIENLSVGFNNGTMHNLDQIIRFDKATSETNSITIRPDVWVLPFLNVYGIFATSKPSTNVGFGIWIPDANNTWHEIFNYNTTANFTAQTLGFGFTPTIGVGGGWVALDMNFSWSDVSALEKPAFVTVFGPRVGKTFKFKKPDQNIAVWVGGFRVKLASGTKGSIALKDVIPADGSMQAKVDAGQQKVTDAQTQVDTWWNSLTPPQQNNPVNKAKYQTANTALTSAGNILDAADGALSTLSNSTIQYSLDKRVKDPWNFIVGSQFQLNKHFMARAEYGFLGSRQQFLTGLQYRFGL
ncbi:hypothetical protein ACPPVU_21030 [Mucilaginibacter sp. McL0603]|uniref:hypothetical protein n=1 Tax=Mucilaginibacter sp. McL0603 TaxID=3415670 RepID=UPI003CE83522